jgi:hypothetical protein
VSAVSWPPRRRRATPRFFAASVASYGVLLVLDTISTLEAMRIFGPSIEINPIMAAAIASFGTTKALWVVHSLAFVPGLWLAYRRPAFLWIAILVFGVVVASNLYQLMTLP